MERLKLSIDEQENCNKLVLDRNYRKAAEALAMQNYNTELWKRTMASEGTTMSVEEHTAMFIHHTRHVVSSSKIF